ncbi:HEAT repeat domain-containing protein [Haloarculaceae archaeon H-GB2-1]|nr:HEAT repeat domain-containing protein [Haloarculaceae archaeon H-GB1-1]MEA5386904.1 HEAT repeat domain-containing protein [Haloarculaceae archaeon H-GB11]MEA5408386.1 HEAT repeat domain-containing protein [Haloarculaceae archaeon H-GB2-1]
MSNGDEESADESEAPADAEEEPAVDDAEPEQSPEAFDERLSAAADDLEGADTEDDLDAVEATLDEIEGDLEAADLPEPDEEEEDAEDPREELESRLSDLRDDLEAQRGPYIEDVAELVREAESTVRDTRWTDDGAPQMAEAVGSYLDDAGSTLVATFEAEDDDPESLADALAEVASVMDDTDLNADDDAETIATLQERTEQLQADLDDAEEWDDLSIREQLEHEGFYDVLDPKKQKDYPVEWSALKVHEQEGNVEQVLLAYDRLDSEFFDEYVFDVLKRMAPAEAYEPVQAQAKRRNHKAIEILGKIGDDRALDTLEGFLDGGNTALEQVSLRAMGEIGSEESVQLVADRLVAEDPNVRSSAARALGLIGDARAISPLSDVLEDDDVDEVRASAAWALVQIGTEDALDAAGEYTDDQSYLVQSEAEKARDALAI